MERNKIISELGKFFKAKELVSTRVYSKFGENSWRLFDTEFLHTLLVIRRDILKVPLICNAGGNQQRGFRENVCPMVMAKTNANAMYISAHCIGKGADLSSPKMTAAEMRATIKEKASLLPYKVRIEDEVTWLHIDVMCEPTQKQKIYFFKP